jgi:uncharacterized protein (DUF488 family)
VRDPRDHLPAARRDGLILFTVGHSIRSLDELVELLRGADVRALVDVRSVPRSRRHPQFAHESLAVALPAHGIEYGWEGGLGGFRRPRADSVNSGWEHEGFRGYADYMPSDEFGRALDELQALARSVRTCIMCAEAQWWRCHRRLISDALFVRGWEVWHLGLGAEPVAHELTPFAVVGDGFSLTYPPLQGELPM